jgi:hypothetical protein
MAREEIGNFLIKFNGQWDLEDLYTFSRSFEQVYFIVLSLQPHKDLRVQRRIRDTYSKYPWQGGYSVVNFNNSLKSNVDQKHVPKITAIRYASPGVLELSLVLPAAIVVHRIIRGRLRSSRCLGGHEAEQPFRRFRKGAALPGGGSCGQRRAGRWSAISVPGRR